MKSCNDCVFFSSNLCLKVICPECPACIEDENEVFTNCYCFERHPDESFAKRYNYKVCDRYIKVTHEVVVSESYFESPEYDKVRNILEKLCYTGYITDNTDKSNTVNVSFYHNSFDCKKLLCKVPVNYIKDVRKISNDE